jgi:hypothetical protein
LASNGKLSIRSGDFSVYVDCTNEEFPLVQPQGAAIKPTGNILEALEKLAPYIGEDASRPWARGILFRGSSAFATNNIVATEYWLGYQFPVDLNIPETVVYELLRIGEEPTLLQMDENCVTFHFSNDRWLRTQLLATTWPDVSKLLDKESNQTPLPEQFYSGLTKILPFIDEHERVYFHKDKIATSVVESSGAAVEIPGMLEGPIFNVKQLQKLEGIVKTIDFSQYPDPCIFYGDYLRGAILGMRP